MKRVIALAAGGLALCAAIGAWIATRIDDLLRERR